MAAVGTRTRPPRLHAHAGRTLSARGWAEVCGVSPPCMRERIRIHGVALAVSMAGYGGERGFCLAAIDRRRDARLATERLALGPLGRARPEAAERSAVDLALDALEARAERVRAYARYVQAVEIVQRWRARHAEVAA